jgi:hypothetical protein
MVRTQNVVFQFQPLRNHFCQGCCVAIANAKWQNKNFSNATTATVNSFGFTTIYVRDMLNMI